MSTPAISIKNLTAGYGARPILEDLSMEISPGELIAVLGPNGSGKTTLLRVLLGLLRPVSGSVEIQGAPPRPASRNVGYIPQHHDFDAGLPIRGRELVELGLTGHRYGIPWPRRDITEAVDHAISEVGAQGYADAPVGLLSGGEQQRLRIAQALLGDPSVLLCDEPLLALDPRRQQEITELIDRHRTTHNAAVLFVTHEINPILPYVDRVLYLVQGRALLGEPDEVFTKETLSELYGAPVDVLEVNGRLFVISGDEGANHLLGHHHEHDNEEVPWG